MVNIFLTAGFVSIIFFIIKFIEMRFIDKESKPLKLLIRDSLVVYVSVVAGDFVVGQLSPFMNDENLILSSSPTAFVDNPPF
jgi:hypothetical protein